MPNKTLLFTSSGTYTPSAGISSVIVECVGGGGGGGSVSAAPQRILAGGGGSSGGYSRGVLLAATIGASQMVTVGVGGTAQAAGGATSFGTLVVANGGNPGEGNDGSTVFGNGSQGAAPGIGNLTLPGAPGGPGMVNPIVGPGGVAITTAVGGTGGSMWGGGVVSPLAGGGTGQVGEDGSLGGGGCGASCSNPVGTATLQGGAGGSGWCLVTEYSP